MREEGSLWSWALIKASIIQFPFVALNACWLHDEFLREFSIDFLASYGNLNNESQRMSAILRNCLTLFLFNNSAQFISINLIKTIPSPFLSHVLSTDYTLLYTLQIKMRRLLQRQCIIIAHWICGKDLWWRDINPFRAL